VLIRLEIMNDTHVIWYKFQVTVGHPTLLFDFLSQTTGRW